MRELGQKSDSWPDFAEFRSFGRGLVFTYLCGYHGVTDTRACSSVWIEQRFPKPLVGRSSRPRPTSFWVVLSKGWGELTGRLPRHNRANSLSYFGIGHDRTFFPTPGHDRSPAPPQGNPSLPIDFPSVSNSKDDDLFRLDIEQHTILADAKAPFPEPGIAQSFRILQGLVLRAVEL